MDRLERILLAKKQTTLWLWWGRLSPLLFTIGAFGLYEIFNTEIPFLFYASWVVFITVSLIWWGWVLKIILDFIKLFGDLHTTVGDIKNEVDTACKEIKKLAPSNVDNPK